MSASRYLRVAAAIPLALVGVGQVAAAQAQPAAVDAAPAPVQLVELTTPAGETTELAEAGLSEEAGSAADAEVPAGTAEGNGVSPARASLLAAAADVPDLERDADLLTEPLEVDGFLVAGFTWSGSEDLPTGTQIYLRVRENGVWSSWYLNEAADAGPDDASGSGGTDEFVTGGADAIQAAVVSGGRALPTDLTLALVPAKPAGEEVLSEDDVTTTEAEPTEITEDTAVAQEQPVDRLVDATQSVDSADETAADEEEGDAETTDATAPAATSAGNGVNLDLPTALAETTTANGLPVPVVTRAEWGANQAYMKWSPKYANAAHVVVHHTAGTNNYTAAQSASIVAGIYYYHAVTLDWGDIGYNFLVDKYGQVFEGRYGTLSSAAGKMVIGGHARGANTGTMGISMMGNYVSTSPTDVQIDRVGKMAGWFLKRSGVTNASASANFTILTTEKYKAGQVVSLPRILAHRDVGYTTCPGDVGYSKMGQIRAIAQNQLGGSSSVPPASGSGSATPAKTIYINNAWSALATSTFMFGGHDSTILAGDWNGDGVDGVARRDGNLYGFRNELTTGQASRTIAYGRADDESYVGDWDGNRTDTFAVRRGNVFYIKNSMSSGVADDVIMYGDPGDQVLIGDWDGDGKDTLAVRRGATYYFRNSMTSGVADHVIVYGHADDQVLVGDWDGDGKDSLAVRRGNIYYVRNSLRGGAADVVQPYGRATDAVLTGDWNGDRLDTLAAVRVP